MYNPTTVREKNFSYTCFDYVTYMHTKRIVVMKLFSYHEQKT